MASNPVSGVMCFSRTLLFAIFLTAPVAGAQTAGRLTGVYNGKYTCAQGPTNLKLSVVVSPIGDVSALFTFYLPAEVPTQGYTYSLHGQFDPQIRKVSLTPVRWETEHAANLGMVGMDGALSGDRLSGRITGGRCTTFDLTRDEGETANMAAVITAQKNGGQPITPSSWTAQIAAAQASAQSSVTGTNTTPAANAIELPAAQTKPSAAVPPAPPSRAQGTQVASAAQRQAPPAVAQAGAKPAAAASPAESGPPNLTDPVLKWEMESPGTSGSSPHPYAHTWINDPFDVITATVFCNRNGLSVSFKTDSYALDKGPAVFVWHINNHDETVTDVRVEVNGSSHLASGFPNEEGGKGIPNEMGIFFYTPDLAQQAAAAQRLQLRTGTGLDSVIGPLAQGAAETEVREAQTASGGPVTDLLNARTIRVYLAFGDWDKKVAASWKRGEKPPIRPWDEKRYLDLNPQHPVLHKFVSECAAKLGIGAAPATAAPAPSSTPPRTQPMAR